MAMETLNLKNPNSGEFRKAPVGFSFTVLFFGFIPPLFRSDWKGSGLILFSCFGLAFIFFVLGIDTRLTFGGFWANLIFAFFYNKLYIKNLVKKGFHAYWLANCNDGRDRETVTEMVNKLDCSIPILEEPQTSQKSQEPEPKKEKSIEDKIKQLNDLKEKNLINDEEYNMKKEKLLEEL